MPGLILLAALAAIFASFAVLAVRFGTDSRDWTVDRFVSTAIGIR
jgi:hypothetical protein